MNLDIKSLIPRGALFVVNHSGGKDSQVMLMPSKTHGRRTLEEVTGVACS